MAAAANVSAGIAGFAFSPATITVTVGDTVTWTNNDSVDHTVTADDGSFSSGPLGNGAIFSRTFRSAGPIAYHCAIHRTMTGTIVVQAAATATPSPTAAATLSGGPSATGSHATPGAAGGANAPPTDTLADPPASPRTDWPVSIPLIAGIALGAQLLRRTSRRR